MRADKINFARLKPATFERTLHRGERAPTFGLRRGGMESVATCAPAGESRKDFCATRDGGFFGFDDEHGRAFAKADAGAPRVEGTTAVRIKQQQRAKTVQRKPRQRIARAGEHKVSLALFNQFGGGKNGHRSGGTCGGKRRHRAERADFPGAQIRRTGTFVKAQRAEAVLVFAEHGGEKSFRPQHSADRRSEHHPGAGGIDFTEAGGESGGSQSFARGDPGKFVGTRAAHVAGEFVHVVAHLADEVVCKARRGKKRERAESGAVGANRFPDRRHAATGGANDAAAGDD